VLFLQSQEITKQSAVLTEKLGDLLDELKKPAISIASYRRALTLDPSPQQRVRILLRLGEILGAHDRQSEAFETYQQLLSDSPDYPDKTDIYRRLEVLAEKLGQTGDVEKYRKLIEGK
jgi:tetratricopeptide (TPR) repeat protein